MENLGDDKLPSCPFLTPKVERRRGRFPVPVYCRMPNGRVRVPTREQLAFLCTAGQHHDCPGYLRWKPEHRATSRGRRAPAER